MGPLLPYLIIAWLVSLIAVGSGAWITATAVGQAACEVRIGKLEAESVIRQQAELGRASIAATRLEKAHATARVDKQILDKRVEATIATKTEPTAAGPQPFYRGECLEPDGLSELAAALAGTGTAPPRSPPAVPGAALPR